MEGNLLGMIPMIIHANLPQTFKRLLRSDNDNSKANSWINKDENCSGHTTHVLFSVKDFVTKIQDKGKKSEKEEPFMSLLDLQGCVTMISYNFFMA